MTAATGNLPVLLEGFFTRRLMQQRQASAHTIASYRDTFRLFLRFAQKRLKVAPSALVLEQLDAPLIAAFLADLEHERGVTARSRNLRQSAIRSFFQYAAFESPGHAGLIQRVLAIPSKRCTRKQVCHLTREEVEALLAAPDRTTWAGRRDHALLLLAVQTGLRLSEITGLRAADVRLGTGAHVHVLGKGRKERCTWLSMWRMWRSSALSSSCCWSISHFSDWWNSRQLWSGFSLRRPLLSNSCSQTASVENSVGT